MTNTNLKEYLYGELKGYGYTPVFADGFIYAEGTIPVGLVAHMDTIFGAPTRITYDNNMMYATYVGQGLGADDRAGIYGILHLLELGLRPTVIFAEDEEIGCVGAKKFATCGIRTNINYLIELDRKGSNDSVFYDCDNKDFESYVNSFGFKSAWGSYSDISEIAPALGVSAVNLSVGYYDQHTSGEYLVISELANTLRRVYKMLMATNNVKYEYVEKYSAYAGYSGKWSDDVFWEDYYSKKTTTGAISKYSSAKTGETYYAEDTTISGNIPLAECILILASSEVVEITGGEGYWITENDDVIDNNGEIVECEIYDSEFRTIGYWDFAVKWDY